LAGGTVVAWVNVRDLDVIEAGNAVDANSGDGSAMILTAAKMRNMDLVFVSGEKTTLKETQKPKAEPTQYQWIINCTKPNTQSMIGTGRFGSIS
jgi:hypothetical protein